MGLHCVGLLACCLALAGCSAFGRKPAAGPAAPANPPPTRTDPPPVASRQPEASGSGGLLAGQVMNGYTQKPGNVYIQVALVRQGNEPTSAPIEVSADDQGYFTIMGLQPGRHYQLTARTNDGSAVMAGTVWATPPNPRVIIHINEDSATPRTPPIPPVPVYPGTKPPPPTWPDDKEASVGARCPVTTTAGRRRIRRRRP